MKKKFLSLVMTLMMSLGICATSFAAEAPGTVGFVNVQVVLNSYPGIQNIAKQIADKRASLQKQFNEQSKGKDAKAQEELQAKLNQELGAFENRKMEPVKKAINKAVLQVANGHGINSVVNMTAMVAGGKDLTNDVVKALAAK